MVASPVHESHAAVQLYPHCLKARCHAAGRHNWSGFQLTQALQMFAPGIQLAKALWYIQMSQDWTPRHSWLLYILNVPEALDLGLGPNLPYP